MTVFKIHAVGELSGAVDESDCVGLLRQELKVRRLCIEHVFAAKVKPLTA